MISEKLAGVWVFIAWTLILIFVVSITGYNGLYGQDSYEYLRYCIGLVGFLEDGVSPGDYFWPVSYPLLGALMAFVTGPQVALQLISIISASWILYMVCMFLFNEFPGREREAVVYVILFLGMSPYFFRYSISSMSDVPALAFACTACYALFRGYKHGHIKWLYATLFFAGLCVFTRLAFLPLVAPLVVFSLYLMLTNFKPVYMLSAILAAVVPLAIHIYFKQYNSTLIFQHYLVTDWSFSNFFKNSFTTIDGNSQFILPNFLFVLSFLVHPGFFFPGLLVLWIFFKKRSLPSLAYPVITVGMILYLLFLAGIPSRNMRYLVPLLPFYITLCFPVFLVITSWFYRQSNFRTVIFTTAVILQVTFMVSAFLPFFRYNRLDRQIASKIIELHPRVLYTFGMDGALKSYGFKGQIINLWEQPLDTAIKGALVLFNKQKNEVQWKGKNPMLNFNLLTGKANAVKIEELESGWEIYEIKKAYPYPDSRFPGNGK